MNPLTISPEEIQIAMAKLAGFREYARKGLRSGDMRDWGIPNAKWLFIMVNCSGGLPDFCSDLNAVALVEDELNFSARQRYYKALQEVMTPIGFEAPIHFKECIRAKAKQKCIALLLADQRKEK